MTAALAEMRSLLGDRPRRPDLLIEHLHLIQDRFRRVSPQHVAALAAEMNLRPDEVRAVALFYPRFDTGDPGAKPPAATVRVCQGIACSMAGSATLFDALARTLGRDSRLARTFCMGRCDKAPVAEVGQRPVERATFEAVESLVRAPGAPPAPSRRTVLDVYVKNGGYRLYRDCLKGAHRPEELIANLERSGLRGLGGAGAPTGDKWRSVRAQPAPRLLVANAHEGEPGAFKDRVYLESDPHRALEGMLIAAWAIEAADAYLFLRDEYSDVRSMLLDELTQFEKAGLTAKTRIHVRRGGGAYVSGEESAMIACLEGRRGIPEIRHQPPSERGLFGRPTLINNLESLYWVRDIVERGPEWFEGQGLGVGKGLRSFSVSGRVKEPGLKLAPAGISVRRLIDEYCNGMAEGHALKAYLPGGASGGILPATLADLALDFDTLEPHGASIGSAAVIVLSHQDDVRDVVRRLAGFFAAQSCGQCELCVTGTGRIVQMIEARNKHDADVESLDLAMTRGSMCGLGHAAPRLLSTAHRYFREEMTRPAP